MVRFARSGRNWEGRQWVVNDAIHFLAAQIEDAWPERHPGDGTVASKGHDEANPNSDHRPYPYNGSGIVYALDMGEVTEDDGALLCDQLRRGRDSRLRYVIHEGRIMSSYSTPTRAAWSWGTYTGPNPHTNHVHVSVNRTAGPGTWDIKLGEDMAHPPSSIRDWRTNHSIPDMPEWAAWDEYVAASGTFADSGRWPAGRADLAWFWETFIKQMQFKIEALQAEVSAQAAEINRLKTQGSGPHSHTEYVKRGQSYTIG